MSGGRAIILVMESTISEAKTVFKRFPAVKLAYLFGSQATGKTGPLSDFDFAVFLDEDDPQKILAIQAHLFDELGRHFKTNKLDVVILNLLEGPEMKYHIVSQGVLIYEQEPFRLLVEPRILNEYFDFYALLKRHNLTRA